MPKVTLDVANAIIQAARTRADSIGVPMNIAVVDCGANLVAFQRMDGAWIGSIEIAKNKAYTARAFDMNTRDLAKLRQPNSPAFGIADSTEHRIAIFSGDVPLLDGKTVVGAIGVSSGKSDQDEKVAEAGAAAFKPENG